jgi:hypothetical protein
MLHDPMFLLLAVFAAEDVCTGLTQRCVPFLIRRAPLRLTLSKWTWWAAFTQTPAPGQLAGARPAALVTAPAGAVGDGFGQVFLVGRVANQQAGRLQWSGGSAYAVAPLQAVAARVAPEPDQPGAGVAGKGLINEMLKAPSPNSWQITLALAAQNGQWNTTRLLKIHCAA